MTGLFLSNLLPHPMLESCDLKTASAILYFSLGFLLKGRDRTWSGCCSVRRASTMFSC